MRVQMYKSYRFIDKDPAIDKLRGPVKASGLSYVQIQNRSGVSAGTLYNWFNGGTRRPQFASLNAVARSLDLEWQLVPRRKK